MRLQDITVHFSADPALSVLQGLVKAALETHARSIMILAADANGCDPAQVDPWLQTLPVPVAGGVFTQLIHGQTNHETGYLVVGWPETLEVRNVGGLSDPAVDFTDAVATAVGAAAQLTSVMVWVDGLSSRIAGFLDGVYDVMGAEVAYFGGGAGSLSFVKKPCIFSNQGMLQDHAQLVLLSQLVSLGVDHGWQTFSGPFVVTQSEGNVIQTLDFQPAFAVYRERVEPDSARIFDAQNFFNIAKGYPFGMAKADQTLVVRDPIATDGKTLTCVGEVPVNSVVYLLKGEAPRLIQAAADGAARVRSDDGPVFMVDCISRVLFLQDRFAEEVQAVQRCMGDRPVVGALTLGEVANGGDYCLEFYNKTMVLAGLVNP
jgi:hypothetical protein